ncbi:hypothetical protein PIB30_034139 [Stylosanthes scabra]|uniref:Uncharacterized protein n=1 Tax=Stylosanthes scabra TaxID=79078 RepID=A0ABU6UEK4_9FABA|nr:hypothetical protein [Stylosanthes scabra]
MATNSVRHALVIILIIGVVVIYVSSGFKARCKELSPIDSLLQGSGSDVRRKKSLMCVTSCKEKYRFDDQQYNSCFTRCIQLFGKPWDYRKKGEVNKKFFNKN